MGLLDIFDKDKRQAASVRKHTKRVLQKYGQPDPRTKAIAALRDQGTEEALAALLMRYTVNVEPGITDQEEKEWVLEILVDAGKKALPPLRQFIVGRDQVTWPLKAVREIAGVQGACDLVCEVLEKMAVQYQREHSKKITLIKHLVELARPSDRITATLMAFLEDMDKDSVIASIEALCVLDETGASRERILEQLKRQGADHPRLKNVVLETFAARGWDVKGYRPTVEELIAEPWYLTGEGVVKKRGDAE